MVKLIEEFNDKSTMKVIILRVRLHFVIFILKKKINLLLYIRSKSKVIILLKIPLISIIKLDLYMSTWSKCGMLYITIC